MPTPAQYSNFEHGYQSSDESAHPSKQTQKNLEKSYMEDATSAFKPSFSEYTSNSGNQADVESQQNAEMRPFYALIENKRIRNMFNTKQIEILERVFEQTHYPDSAMREQLSRSLGLRVVRIQVWFQNRRAKYKKMDASGGGKSGKMDFFDTSLIKNKLKALSIPSFYFYLSYTILINKSV
jgi:hypothetical protein